MFDVMSSSSESTNSLTQEQLQKAKVAIDFLSSLPKTEGNIFYIIFAILINPSDNDGPSSSSRASRDYASGASGRANG